MHKTTHIFILLLAWFIFAFWGIVSNEVMMPIPLLLAIMTFFGFLTTLLLKQDKFITWNKTAFIISIILMLDLFFLVFSFRYVDFATVITLHYFAPVLVMFFSEIILKEKVNIKDIALSSIGFLGVVLLFVHELRFEGNYLHTLGVILAFLSSITLAGNIIYQRLYMKENQVNYAMAVRQYNAYMLIICLIVIIPIWILLDFDKAIIGLTTSFTMKNIIIAGVAGILIQGVAMILFNSSIRFVQARTIAKISYTEIFWVIASGAVIYNQHLYPLQIIGMAIILLVAYITITYEK